MVFRRSSFTTTILSVRLPFNTIHRFNFYTLYYTKTIFRSLSPQKYLLLFIFSFLARIKCQNIILYYFTILHFFWYWRSAHNSCSKYEEHGMASPMKYNIQLHNRHLIRKTKIHSKHFYCHKNCHKHSHQALGSSELNWIPRSSKSWSAPSCRGQEQNNIRALHLQQQQPVIYGFIKFIILCHHYQGFLMTKSLTTRIYFWLLSLFKVVIKK